MLVGFIYNLLIIPSQHQRIQHLSSQSNKHSPKENLPPGKNLQEKLRKEMGDIESDNKAQ